MSSKKEHDNLVSGRLSGGDGSAGHPKKAAKEEYGTGRLGISVEKDAAAAAENTPEPVKPLAPVKKQYQYGLPPAPKTQAKASVEKTPPPLTPFSEEKSQRKELFDFTPQEATTAKILSSKPKAAPSETSADSFNADASKFRQYLERWKGFKRETKLFIIAMTLIGMFLSVSLLPSGGSTPKEASARSLAVTPAVTVAHPVASEQAVSEPSRTYRSPVERPRPQPRRSRLDTARDINTSPEAPPKESFLSKTFSLLKETAAANAKPSPAPQASLSAAQKPAEAPPETPPPAPERKFIACPYGYHLSGIMQMPSGRFANLNGRYVAIGEMVNNASVVEIRDFLVVMQRGEEYFLVGVSSEPYRGDSSYEGSPFEKHSLDEAAEEPRDDRRAEDERDSRSYRKNSSRDRRRDYDEQDRDEEED